MRLRLDVLGVDADVADVRIGERDDLPGVRGIGEDLLVAGHRGVEHDLADGHARGADRAAAEHRAVGEREHGRHRRREQRGGGGDVGVRGVHGGRRRNGEGAHRHETFPAHPFNSTAKRLVRQTREEASIDHLIGAGEKVAGHRETYRTRRLLVDDQLEFHRLLDGEVCRPSLLSVSCRRSRPRAGTGRHSWRRSS